MVVKNINAFISLCLSREALGFLGAAAIITLAMMIPGKVNTGIPVTIVKIQSMVVVLIIFKFFLEY